MGQRSQASSDTVLMFGKTVLGVLQRCEPCFFAVSALIISFTPWVFSVVPKYNSNSSLKTKKPECIIDGQKHFSLIGKGLLHQMVLSI